MGEGDLMVADHWFRKIEKILEAMEITSDAIKIRLLAFQLEGESRYGGIGSRPPGIGRL